MNWFTQKQLKGIFYLFFKPMLSYNYLFEFILL